MRPSCEQILHMPILKKHVETMETDISDGVNPALLATIYMPDYIKRLKLPEPNYDKLRPVISEPNMGEAMSGIQRKLTTNRLS
jgi:hypothetical protein